MSTDNKDKKNIKVVIGANYGSEGKGMVTDYLCNQLHGKSIVVVTNGGVQRGHCVETLLDEGFSFHSIGSGSLRGCDTYISEDFVFNPVMFVKELVVFLNLYPKKRIKIYINKKVRWSVQYDMILNQCLLYHENRNNSSGFGVYETIRRYEYLNKNKYLCYSMEEFYKLSDKDKEIYLSYLLGYMIEKLQEYGIKLQDSKIDSSIWEVLGQNSGLIDTVIYCTNEIFNSDYVEFVEDDSILDRYDNIVFENGQGLLLDRDLDNEFGTSTNTGLKIPYSIIENRYNGLDVEVLYVSRTYITKHGDGHLANELHTKDDFIENHIYLDSDYELNTCNEFQGELRYATLDLYDLVDRCKTDVERTCINSNNTYSTSIVLTHMNECEIDENDLKVASYTEDIKFYRTYGRASEYIREYCFWEE